MRALTVAALLALFGGVPAEAQRLSEARVASVVGDSSVRDTVQHPTGRRVAAALTIGFFAGVTMLRVPVCFSNPCGWDFRPAAAGVFAGMVMGSALIPAKRCSLLKRMWVSFAGTAAGAVVSLVVAEKSHMAKDGAAIVATALAGGAPVVGGVIALRRCD